MSRKISYIIGNSIALENIPSWSSFIVEFRDEVFQLINDGHITKIVLILMNRTEERKKMP